MSITSAAGEVQNPGLAEGRRRKFGANQEEL